MNKAYNGNRKSFLFVLVMCLVLFNVVFGLCGCGLDTFYYIEAPVAVTRPEINTETAIDKQTFIFNTIEQTTNPSFSFVGTEVYYKIYDDENQFKSERDYLDSLSKDDKITYAADKLIYPVGSGGYGYQQLKLKDSTDNVLIPYTGFNKQIKIRLSTDSESDVNFSASIFKNDIFVGIPLRYNFKNFDFIKGTDNVPDPLDQSQLDVKYIEKPNNDHKWYICLFAVAKGHDAAYTNYYSNITYLGAVTILSKDN